MLAWRNTLSALIALTVFCSSASGNQWQISSPSGTVRAILALDDLGSLEGYSPGVRLYYRIDRDSQKGRVPVLPFSPLGIMRKDQGFVEGLQLVSAGESRQIDEEYTLVHGKRRQCSVKATRQSLTFQNAAGARLQIEWHLADDGAAFRYRFPEQSEEVHTVVAESTGFVVPERAKAWIQPYQEASQWTPSYEDYYQNGSPAGTTSPTQAGWCLPALFELPGASCWVLLAEAGVDAGYCGTRLASEAPGGHYRIRMPDPGEGNGVGAVEPSSTLPWATPWRVILVGETLDTIVGSTMVTDLCPPCKIENTDWIKPGRAAWSWWSDHDSPQDYRKQIEFIDLASEMGWEYYLVDANWTLMNGGNVRQMAEYAESKGVGLLLWYNSGGAHNYVTEKPRGTLTHPYLRDFEFSLLEKWGIKGIKVDFFHSDKQDRMAQYLAILEDAARHRIMINFHGCTAPRGWSRTWPNLMTMESVKGAECYTFAADYPDKAPWHNTILPFTRNVIGPMDYTPCTFSDDRNPHITTNAHELALSVAFETGWLHLADRVSAYRNLPDGPREFLKNVPVVWDETRAIGGRPGEMASIARRHGDVWYVGGINGENEPKNAALDLGFLEEGKYELALIGDGRDARSFGEKTMVVQRNSPVRIAMRPFGGFVATIRAAEQ